MPQLSCLGLLCVIRKSGSKGPTVTVQDVQHVRLRVCKIKDNNNVQGCGSFERLESNVVVPN